MASTTTREDAVQQLRDITHVDDEVARQLLEATGWSVEDALAVHFAAHAGDDEVPPGASGGASNAVVAGQAAAREAQRLSSTPPPRAGEEVNEREQEEEDLQTSQHEPPQESVGWFGTLGRALSNISQAFLGIASEDFDAWFASRYGAPTPVFLKDSFGEAVRAALAEEKLLLIWFHQEESPATESLCRRVFQNELVLSVLSKTYVLWAGDVARFEPGQLSRLLAITRYPALVVCQPLRHNFDAQAYCLEWPLGTFAQPLLKFAPTQDGEGLDSDQVIAALTATAEDHQDTLRAREVESQQRTLRLAEERRLREEQDREFQESLLADQLAAAKRDAEGTVAEAAACADSEAEAAKAAKAEAEQKAEAERQAEEKQRLERGAAILATAEPAPNGKDTAKLSLKLPSGERLQRVFSAQQCLQEVYDWAHCCRPEAKPKKFELSMTFPAKTLTDRSASLADLGLTPSAALFLKPGDE